MDRDPYATIDARDQPNGAAQASSAALLDLVGPLFRGRTMAIELGSGSGSLLLGHAGTFKRVRGVDASAEHRSKLRERAASAGIDNVETFGFDQPWFEPTGAADYVYALDLFRQTEDRVEAANYLQQIAMVLRPGGIAHVRFDTRPSDFAFRLRQRLPNGLRPPDERRGSMPVRRPEAWVRDRVRGADMEIIGERGPGTANHWVGARRREARLARPD